MIKKKFIGIIFCGILVVVKTSTFEIHQKKIFSIKFILFGKFEIKRIFEIRKESNDKKAKRKQIIARKK